MLEKNLMKAELLYPQSIWAPRAVLMSAYGYFLKDIIMMQ